MIPVIYNLYITLVIICVLPYIGGESKEQVLADLSSKEVLHNFFYELFSQTSAGYVLYGNKPIYLLNPSDERSCGIGTEEHKKSCELWEALSAWQDLQLGNKQSDYLLLITSQDLDPNVFNHEVLFINRSALLKVVSDNLLLFQAQMGWNITPEGLLNALVEKKSNISALFKGKTALLGIILGYGTKNGLAFERGTNVLKPLVNQQSLLPPYRKDLPMFTIEEVVKQGKRSCREPGFGYSSIQEELESLSCSMAHPTDNYLGTGTKIGFSYFKDAPESKSLLHMYEHAQTAVDRSLHSVNFIDDVLAKFNVSIDKSQSNRNCLRDQETVKLLPKIVAHSIWEHFSEIEYGDATGEGLDHFIAGMKAANESMVDELNYEDAAFLDVYQYQLSTFRNLKLNFEASRAFLQAASTQPGVCCVVPNKLYYKVVQLGDGQHITDKTEEVAMHFLINDINDQILTGSYRLSPAQVFQVIRLIPGLAWGVQGMKINEVRDIFIHQDFAYGIHSEFGSGKALCVRVELARIKDGPDEQKLPELIPVDLHYLHDNQICTKEQFELLKKKYFYLCGLRTWKHYKQAKNFFTLETILDELNKMTRNEKCESILTENNKRKLRQFNLYLYSLERV